MSKPRPSTYYDAALKMTAGGVPTEVVEHAPGMSWAKLVNRFPDARRDEGYPSIPNDLYCGRCRCHVNRIPCVRCDVTVGNGFDRLEIPAGS